MKWLYTVDGKPAFYQTDNGYLYPAGGGAHVYQVSEGTWYDRSGEPAFYIRGQWVCTPQGQRTYYYDL